MYSYSHQTYDNTSLQQKKKPHIYKQEAHVALGHSPEKRAKGNITQYIDFTLRL